MLDCNTIRDTIRFFSTREHAHHGHEAQREHVVDAHRRADPRAAAQKPREQRRMDES